MRKEDVPELAEAIQKNKTISCLYRGNVFLSGVEQLVDAWLKAEGITAKRITIKAGERTAYVCIEVENIEQNQQINLRCIRKPFAMYMDCRRLQEGRKATFERWIIDTGIPMS